MFEKIKKRIESRKKVHTIRFEVKHMPVPGKEDFIGESISIDMGKFGEKVYRFCLYNNIEYIHMYETFIEIRGTIEDRDKLYDYLLERFSKWIELKPR